VRTEDIYSDIERLAEVLGDIWMLLGTMRETVQLPLETRFLLLPSMPSMNRITKMRTFQQKISFLCYPPPAKIVVLNITVKFVRVERAAVVDGAFSSVLMMKYQGGGGDGKDLSFPSPKVCLVSSSTFLCVYFLF